MRRSPATRAVLEPVLPLAREVDGEQDDHQAAEQRGAQQGQPGATAAEDFHRPASAPPGASVATKNWMTAASAFLPCSGFFAACAATPRNWMRKCVQASDRRHGMGARGESAGLRKRGAGQCADSAGITESMLSVGTSTLTSSGYFNPIPVLSTTTLSLSASQPASRS